MAAENILQFEFNFEIYVCNICITMNLEFTKGNFFSGSVIVYFGFENIYEARHLYFSIHGSLSFIENTINYIK